MDPNTGGTPTLPATVSPPRGYVLSGKIMLSGIVVLLSIVIFILLLHFYIRWHVVRRYDRRRRRRRRNRLIFASSSSDLPNSNPSAPRRLDSDVLNSLPVGVFSGEDVDGLEAAECAVCINDFGEGEKVRVLPRCGHRFHVDCVDMWFCSHSTCPLCRCAVEAVTPPAPETESVSVSVSVSDPAVSGLAVSDPDPRNREVRIEMPEEPGSGSTSTGVVPVKAPEHRRVSSIRRFLIGIQIANPDLERGEPLDRATPPPPPPNAQ
ncbi:RING-H2 finger protein ATL3-like [Iris pallida]|uniref:RING-type E3 ubiquitin transferase n=1 Tax=Iris pallida TaxID=29817 RepID=A0AAX6IHL5_IRIPA|nr:RING-H2 finger protein ATL3-like [Iris pallida]